MLPSALSPTSQTYGTGRLYLVHGGGEARQMKSHSTARIVATEIAVLPLQVILLVAAFFPVMIIGVLISPIRSSWTEKIFRAFVHANDSFSRFRLRMAGDPDPSRNYSNLMPPNPN